MTAMGEGFWPRVDKDGPVVRSELGPCWVWKSSRNRPRGYGSFKAQRAHRVSWELVNGPIPDGLWVLHKCDNPPCVRPDHLFLGTVGDNVRDMTAKGRGVVPRKLTADQVAIICRRVIAGEKRRAVAKDFGVHVDTVDSIMQGTAWRHVPEGLEHRRLVRAHIKLPDDQVAEMRAKYSTGGVTIADLGRSFGISKSQASRIVNGEQRLGGVRPFGRPRGWR